jgi:hypothetical protein
MYLYSKGVSIVCNINQKQHAMFMLGRCILFNPYDNPTPTKPFFAWLGGDVKTSKNCVIWALLTLASNWQRLNSMMVVTQMGIVAINVEG